MNRNFLVFFLTLVLSSITHAKLTEIDITDKTINLGQSLEYFIDADNKWSDGDVLSGLAFEQFKPHEKAILSVGYQDHPIWIKLKLHNKTTEMNSWILGINYAPLDKVTLFSAQPDGHYKTHEQGDHRPYKNRDYDSNSFPFSIQLPTFSTKTFYLKVENKSSIRIPISLATEEVYLKHQQDLKLIYGLLFGLMVALILFNAFLFISTRELGYFFYVAYAVYFIAYQSSRFGLLTQYVWLDNIWLSDRSLPFTLFGVILFSALLTQHFLHTKEFTPTLHKLLYIPIVYSIIATPLSLVIPNYYYVVQTAGISVSLFFAFILVVSLVNLVKGNRFARFYFPAWLCLIIGVVIDAAASFGLIESSLLSSHISLFAGGLEALLLSIALGDRINILQAEKEQVQQEAQKALMQSHDNLKRSNQIKDEFLATVSHELKTPVNGVIGNLELLKSTMLDKSQVGYLGNATDSAAKLALMVDEILGFSELETGTIKLRNEPFEFNELIHGIQKTFVELCNSKDLEFIVHLDAQIPNYFTGDVEKLLHLLSLVLDNAVKFTDKGKVELRIDRLNQCNELKNLIKFSVIDTGSGIPENLQSKIFQSFYQTDGSASRKHGGLGIGLATCKQLAKLFHGDITVSSKPGAGSRFEITVELEGISQAEIKQRKQALAQETPETSTAQENKPTKSLPVLRDNKIENDSIDILIVEDNAVNQRLLVNMCRKLGYKTHAANDGHEAIHSFLVEKVDIILMDCQMPVMDGLEATKQIRHMEKGYEIPIIAVTANTSHEDRRKCAEVGMNDFIAKPINMKTIKAAIERALLTPANLYHDPDNAMQLVHPASVRFE